MWEVDRASKKLERGLQKRWAAEEALEAANAALPEAACADEDARLALATAKAGLQSTHVAEQAGLPPGSLAPGADVAKFAIAQTAVEALEGLALPSELQGAAGGLVGLLGEQLEAAAATGAADAAAPPGAGDDGADDADADDDLMGDDIAGLAEAVSNLDAAKRKQMEELLGAPLPKRSCSRTPGKEPGRG